MSDTQEDTIKHLREKLAEAQAELQRAQEALTLQGSTLKALNEGYVRVQNALNHAKLIIRSESGLEQVERMERGEH